MKEYKNVIWTSSLDFDDFNEYYKSLFPDESDEELIKRMYFDNDENLSEVRSDLDFQFNQPILAIADLGLWNGRHKGYHLINSGSLKECFYSECEYVTWYIDRRGDLRCEATHHDGTNHYLYRVFKDNATDAQISNLTEKIYLNKVSRSDITRITKRLGDEIAAIYGFGIPYKKKAHVA